ncbi:MAG: DUF1858 domain-containing protein [Lachnospiraceae bacterium]|nr:DUF1858 domain-containing protein [Lachnospiraceae bacterium]
MEETKLITKDMTIEEAMNVSPMVANLLMSTGMHCVTCFAAQGETLEEAAMVHGYDVEDILEILNENIANENAAS